MTFTVVGLPCSATRSRGSTVRKYGWSCLIGCSPSRNDGGASPLPLPQDEGERPSTKSSLPPCSTNDSGSQVFVVARPSTFNDCTYFVAVLAAGAVMVMSLPPSRLIFTDVNSGLLSTSSARDGTCG